MALPQWESWEGLIFKKPCFALGPQTPFSLFPCEWSDSSDCLVPHPSLPSPGAEEDLDGNGIEDGIIISLRVTPFTMLVRCDGDGLVISEVVKFLDSGRLQATYLLAMKDRVGICVSTAMTELLGLEHSFLV